MWLRKGLVGLVAVLTFGMVVPTSYIHNDTKPSRESVQRSRADVSSPTIVLPEELTETEKDSEESEGELSWRDVARPFDTKDELTRAFELFATKKAETQGLHKFGPAISDQIGETYQRDIVPKFGQAIALMGEKADVELIRNIEISNDPSAGLGERIMHLYDGQTGKELVKFHVRRDHPPLDGYWFNFHYHTYEDGFQAHHEIGKIYWDKNTPPHWTA